MIAPIGDKERLIRLNFFSQYPKKGQESRPIPLGSGGCKSEDPRDGAGARLPGLQGCSGGEAGTDGVSAVIAIR